MDKNRFEVEIDGNSYLLKTDKSKEDTDKIVELVEEKILDAKKTIKYRNPVMQSILACLNMADDLFETKTQLLRLEKVSNEAIKNYEPIKDAYQKFRLSFQDNLNKLNIANNENNELKQNYDKLKDDYSRIKEDYDKLIKQRDEFKIKAESQDEIFEDIVNENDNLRKKVKELENIIEEAKNGSNYY